MKLLFQEQAIELTQPVMTEEVIENINLLLGKEYYFSHLIADGMKVEESPEQYLLDKVDSINELQVIAVEAKEFVNNLLLSAEEYVRRAIPHLDDLADAFYHDPTSENWMTLDELLEGIQWLASMITTVDQSTVRPQNWDAVVEPAVELQDEFGTLEEALENVDTVLVADILQYEVQPTFETFAEEIKRAVDTEGMRHDLN